MIFVDSGSSQYLSKVIVLVVCLILSAFFSSSETALTSLSKIRLRAMVDEGVKNAKLIQKVTDNSSKLLSAILIGNNIVNIGASSLGTVIATDLFGSSGVGIATGVLTILVLIFGEVTPKSFASDNAEKVSCFCVKPIAFCMIIFTPFIFLLNIITGFIFKLIGKQGDQQPAVTENELRTMVDVSHEEGVLEVDEREMITNVVDFRSSTAEEVMIPRIDIVAIPDDLPYDEVVKVFKEKKFTRLPVYNETNDHIVGTLSFKDIMLLDDIKIKDFKVSDYMKEPYFTYESKQCSKLFADMKRESISMSIVLDEYGGTAGIVTLQDLIQEIVGDIIDEERDDEEEIQSINDGEYLVDGSTKLDDVNDVLGTDFENDDIESIGGYVIAIIDRFPEKGEVVEDTAAKFFIEEIDKNRIVKLKIILTPENEEEEEKEK
ncbi:MAG: hemolysin family protein [Clostridia bacterium]|nr:hemolysin family protein [Clostridia bacterium]